MSSETETTKLRGSRIVIMSLTLMIVWFTICFKSVYYCVGNNCFSAVWAFNSLNRTKFWNYENIQLKRHLIIALATVNLAYLLPVTCSKVAVGGREPCISERAKRVSGSLTITSERLTYYNCSGSLTITSKVSERLTYYNGLLLLWQTQPALL